MIVHRSTESLVIERLDIPATESPSVERDSFIFLDEDYRELEHDELSPVKTRKITRTMGTLVLFFLQLPQGRVHIRVRHSWSEEFREGWIREGLSRYRGFWNPSICQQKHLTSLPLMDWRKNNGWTRIEPIQQRIQVQRLRLKERCHFHFNQFLKIPLQSQTKPSLILVIETSWSGLYTMDGWSSTWLIWSGIAK